MSNPLKAIGKAFKSVVRVIKKVALPALAIGAVVLTGGAALGVLPSVGSLAAKLGISAGLQTVLTSAATSATIGAGMSAVTGGNIIKGATTGFVTGGVLGGVNAAFGGTTDIFGRAAQTGTKGLGTAANAAGTGGGLPLAAQGTTDLAAAAGNAMNGGLPLAAQGTTDLAARAGSIGLGGFSSSVPSVAAVPSSGGVLGFINRNPVVSGMAIQGLGQGMMAREQARDAQRERDQIAANYSDTSGLSQYQSAGGNYPMAADVFNAAIYSGKKAEYDPRTGRIKVGG